MSHDNCNYSSTAKQIRRPHWLSRCSGKAKSENAVSHQRVTEAFVTGSLCRLANPAQHVRGRSVRLVVATAAGGRRRRRDLVCLRSSDFARLCRRLGGECEGDFLLCLFYFLIKTCVSSVFEDLSLLVSSLVAAAHNRIQANRPTTVSRF